MNIPRDPWDMGDLTHIIFPPPSNQNIDCNGCFAIVELFHLISFLWIQWEGHKGFLCMWGGGWGIEAQNCCASVPTNHMYLLEKYDCDVLCSHVNQNSCKAVNGILFTPSFTTITVSMHQKVYMADACAIWILASIPSSAVTVTIIFGKENTESWHLFWKHVVELHPLMNCHDITIITDQDKGQMNALANQLGHWCQNIIKKCGGC